MASGPTDPAWSAPTETALALARAYHRVIAPSETLEFLDITCSASLYELLGVSRPNLSRDDSVADNPCRFVFVA